ncbi:inorganic phosphate transporter [Candidatus Halobonum tyrrellensis]|uniref:Phosphate transporter n=1 Tax=Candidatus Halobonum tyrrellensis G22 TaxID=1324957 RepID=V4HBB4_9EURY|nr:inorganic phosphate transporter [Candidatus Halobonum tyrrellensis]ESP87995.1 phosphate permease [Candidatus Halobonum tyrrellensis G22]
MVATLLLVGLGVAVFVGFNIGGSSTGVAFGPAVGSGLLSKLAAAALMTGFAFAGAWTVGRGVIETMGGRIVPSSEFTLVASVGVLFFVGLALLISNTFGVPASTSMTAVGAIAGLGAATNSLNSEVMLRIVGWWLVSPVIAFWVCAMIGRYLYPYLDAAFPIDRTAGGVVDVAVDGGVPRISRAPNTSRSELLGTVLVVAIACYMAFSAGASNAANAVAPLVGSPEANLSADLGIVIASGAIGLGAFTIARRTLDTVGNDLTDLPLLAALIVELVSASLIAFLSYIDIPASLAVSATMCIVGLGWGRATRTTSVGDAVHGERPEVSVNALAAEGEADGSVPDVGEEEEDELLADDLFNPGTTGRVIFFWMLTPSLSFAASYALFSLAPV